MEVIQHFSSIEQAYLARSFLENEGIESYVWDENTAGLYPLFNPSLGMVRLVVAEEDMDRARQLLIVFG
jgi:hypothetical protein